jgi:hypothetical protein
MKYINLLILFLLSQSLAAQQPDYLASRNCTFIQNEKYGESDRNRFDIVLPKSDKPTPLIIYIHGGGFARGDKNEAWKGREKDILYFLDHNIAFATVSYRFYKPDDSAGVKVCLNDIAAALQYIRYHAKKFNINKELVACYGSSAGAGSSLFLAVHDDMALPNDTTFRGESTRIKCAGLLSTQATYNMPRWRSYIPFLRLVTCLQHKKFYNSAANFYGYPTYKSLKPQKDAVIKEFDMLEMVSPDDPPVYIMNLQKERFPKNNKLINHHRKHAIVLAKKFKEQNFEYKLFVRNKQLKSEDDIDYPVRNFLVEHLK